MFVHMEAHSSPDQPGNSVLRALKFLLEILNRVPYNLLNLGRCCGVHFGVVLSHTPATPPGKGYGVNFLQEEASKERIRCKFPI